MKWLSREVTWKAFTYIKKPSMCRLNIDRIWVCIILSVDSKACYIMGKSWCTKVFGIVPQICRAVRTKAALVGKTLQRG